MATMSGAACQAEVRDQALLPILPRSSQGPRTRTILYHFPGHVIGAGSEVRHLAPMWDVGASGGGGLTGSIPVPAP